MCKKSEQYNECLEELMLILENEIYTYFFPPSIDSDFSMPSGREGEYLERALKNISAKFWCYDSKSYLLRLHHTSSGDCRLTSESVGT